MSRGGGKCILLIQKGQTLICPFEWVNIRCPSPYLYLHFVNLRLGEIQRLPHNLDMATMLAHDSKFDIVNG